MDAVERYRKRRARRLATRFDEEIWRTTDRGKHYALETETGEITKGNIGQKSGTAKTGGAKPVSDRLQEGEKYDRARKIEYARSMLENFKDSGSEYTVKKLSTRLKRAFNKQMREIPDGTRIEIEDRGIYGVTENKYVFEKHGDKFDGHYIEQYADYNDKDYEGIGLKDLYNIYCNTKGKNPSISFRNKSATKETVSSAKKECDSLGLKTETIGGNVYVEIPMRNINEAALKGDMIWARITDDHIGGYMGKIGDFNIYGSIRNPKKGDPFGYELAFDKMRRK